MFWIWGFFVVLGCFVFVLFVSWEEKIATKIWSLRDPEAYLPLSNAIYITKTMAILFYFFFIE